MIAIGTQIGVALVFEGKEDVEALIGGLNRLIGEGGSKDSFVYLVTDDNVERRRILSVIRALEDGGLPQFASCPPPGRYTVTGRGSSL